METDGATQTIFSAKLSNMRMNDGKRGEASGFKGNWRWDFLEAMSVGVICFLRRGLVALCTTSSSLPPTGIWWQTRFNLPAMSSWVQLLIALCGGVTGEKWILVVGYDSEQKEVWIYVSLVYWDLSHKHLWTETDEWLQSKMWSQWETKTLLHLCFNCTTPLEFWD